MYLNHLFPSCFSINFVFSQFQMLALNYFIFIFCYFYIGRNFTSVKFNLLLLRDLEMFCFSECNAVRCERPDAFWMHENGLSNFSCSKMKKKKFFSEVIINIIFSLSLCQNIFPFTYCFFENYLLWEKNVYVFNVIIE